MCGLRQRRANPGAGERGIVKEYHKIKTIYRRDEKTFKVTPEFSCPEFGALAKIDWLFTEKVDGTNIRILWQDGLRRFGGKTDNAQIPAFLVDRLIELFPEAKLAEALSEAGDAPVCLYGEGYGARIQKGGGNYKADGVDFVLFDVKVGDWWLERENIEVIAATLNVPVVPIIGRGTLGIAAKLAADGFPSRWGDFTAEGIVARPAVELFNRTGDRIIAKIKHKDF